MEATKAKDLTTTAVGGGLGIEQLYEAVNALMLEGATGEEWLALGKGLALIAFGFLAWRQQS